MKIVDVTDPAIPIELGEIPTTGTTEDVIVEDDYAYVVSGYRGLHVYDVSDPAASIEVAAIDTIDVDDLKKRGSYLYLIGGDFHVVDVSDPTAPVVVSTIDSIGGYKIAISGDYAYTTANVSSTIRVTDISDPLNPVFINNTYASGYCAGLDVLGNFLYVANKHSGVKVFDITNPLEIEVAGYFDTPGYGEDVVVIDSFVFVADAHAGLIVLEHNPPPDDPLIIELEEGWNIFSYPYEGGLDVSLLPSSVIGSPYSYNNASGAYVAVTSMEAGLGYWLLVSEETIWDTGLEPVALDAVTVNFSTGWNLLGLSGSSLVGTYFDGYSELILPTYEFSPSTGTYIEPESYEPHKGFFFLSLEEFSLAIE